jgi:hypothetical protein
VWPNATATLFRSAAAHDPPVEDLEYPMSGAANTTPVRKSRGERIARVLVIAGILVVWSGVACTAALELIAG